MTIPNRPPLWWAMSDACADHPRGVVDLHPAAVAAEIRALRDWIMAELATDPEDAGWGPANLIELPDLEDLLTTEADRAERGDA